MYAIRSYYGDHVTPGKHSSELFCEAASNFIKDYNSNEPFFLYVAFMAPHDPRTMPEKFLNMYDPDKITLPPNYMLEHPVITSYSIHYTKLYEVAGYSQTLKVVPWPGALCTSILPLRASATVVWWTSYNFV